MNYLEKKEKILLVDDELETLEYIKEILEDRYDVTIAGSGKDALALLKNEKYDLFVIDINMPVMNGFELAREIKEDIRIESTPLIFVTAFSEIEKISTGFVLGAVDYIIKPLRIQEFLLRIDHHLKVAKEQNKLYLQNIELNKKIRDLTNDLLIHEEHLISETTFQNTENIFSCNDKRIQENKKRSDDFTLKITKIQETLEKQQKILNQTKNMLDFSSCNI